MKQKKIIMVIAILFVGTLAALGAIRQSGPGEKPFARIGHETTELGHDHGASDPHAGHEHGAEEHHQEPQRTIEAHDDHGGHDHDTEEDHGHEGHHHAAGEECNDGEICPEHLVAEIEDALCRSEHISQLMPGEGLKVRLASLEAAERAGIVTSEPVPISRAGGMELPGRVGFNRNRLARISPLASGIVQQVFVQPGTAVEKDQVLAEIATPEIAALKAQLLSAQARRSQTRETFLREKDLLERGITSRQEFLEAQAEYRSADSAVDQFRQQLSNYGLSQRAIEALSRTGSNSALLEVRSPFAGVVVAMETAMGESVSAGSPLFTVADLDTLWIELSIPESRIYEADVGAPVEARFDGLPETVFKGSIFQVGAALDERTRVLKALAEVDNGGHRLKAGMFGQVRIVSGSVPEALAIPSEALQSIDGAPFVFVRLEDDLFEVRRVEAGLAQNGMIPVRAGIADTDPIVIRQGFALKSEVLKARLGASCADH